MATTEASFNTSYEAMSSGGIFWNWLGSSKITPSTTNNGLTPPVIDDCHLKRTDATWLGSPPGWVITRPATLPDNWSIGLIIAPWLKFLAEIFSTAPVKSFFFAVP